MRTQKLAGSLGAMALTLAVELPQGSMAEASYDMDCKVILCLAGGFPAGCADAKSYMLARISPPNPQPPFGFCPMSDGSQYTDFKAPYSLPGPREPEGWDCRDEKHLYLHYHDHDGDTDDFKVFCYGETKEVYLGSEDGVDQYTTHYLDQDPAIRVNLEIQIILEPDTEAEYVSPVFRMNYAGYVNASPS